VTVEPGVNDIQIELSDGTLFEVNLDGATNMGRVLQLLNAASPGASAFEAMLNEDVDGLQLVDRTGGPEIFEATAVNESVAVFSLAVNKSGDPSDVEGELVIVGDTLHRDTLSDHFFLRDGSLNVVTTVDVPTFTGPATNAPQPQFGFVEIDVVGGSTGSVGAPMTFSVTLTDPATQAADNRATMRELFEDIDELSPLIDTAVLTGNIAATLQIRPDVSTLNAVGISNISPAEFTFDIDLSSATPDMGTLDSTINNPVYRLLNANEHVSGDDVAAALDDLSAYLHASEMHDELGSALPAIDKPLGPSVGIGDVFDTAFNTLRTDSPESLQSTIAQLPANSAITFDDTANPTLRFDLDVASALASQLPLNLDLTTLGVNLGSFGLQNVPRIVDSASMDPFSTLTANLLDLISTVNFNVDLGVDLSTPSAPNSFLYDTTSAAYLFTLNKADLNFDALAGALESNVVTDSVSYDATGSSSSPASVVVALVNDAVDGRHAFDGQMLARTNVDLIGELNVMLPMGFSSLGITPAVDCNNPGVGEEPCLIVEQTNGITNVASFNGPDVATLQLAVDLSGDLSSFAVGWDNLLQYLDTALDEAVLNSPLPIVGNQLSDAVRFMHDTRQQALDNLNAIVGTPDAFDVQMALFEAFQAAGVGSGSMLVDRDSSGSLTQSDIQLTQISNEVRYDFALHRALDIVVEPQVAFDLGMPDLPLDLDGPVQLSIGFDWSIGVGVSKTHGAFIDTSQTDEISIDFEATVGQISSTGKLGFMPVTVTPNGAQPIRTAGNYTIDIMEPGSDGFLSFAETASDPPASSIVAASLSGAAGLDSNLAVTLESNLGDTIDLLWIRNDLSESPTQPNRAKHDSSQSEKPDDSLKPFDEWFKELSKL